jgi:hypothetical protein
MVVRVSQDIEPGTVVPLTDDKGQRIGLATIRRVPYTGGFPPSLELTAEVETKDPALLKMLSRDEDLYLVPNK